MLGRRQRTSCSSFIRRDLVSESSYLSANMTLAEIYRLRNWAGQTNNRSLLSDVKRHFNGKSGAAGSSPAVNEDGAESFLHLTTTLDEVLEYVLPEILIVVDHEITNTGEAERNCHILQEVVHAKHGDAIKVNMHSGEIDGDRLEKYHVVLLALPTCFAVLKARGSETSGKVVPYDSLIKGGRDA